MASLHGNTYGVGRDIVDYLTTVACHFKLTIFVTSEPRPDQRGRQDDAYDVVSSSGNGT